MNATPNTAMAWVQAGFQAQQRGETANAEAAYQQALRLRPEHPAALQLLGRLALFPSMAWHGTRPFEAEAERLTIAFDVVPT